MRHKTILVAVLLTYLLVSFVPQIGLMSIMGKGKGKGSGSPG